MKNVPLIIWSVQHQHEEHLKSCKPEEAQKQTNIAHQ